jgi:electron transfer flavoprotein beta subunit
VKILVAIKQVPARDSQLQLVPGTNWIDESSLSFEMNEPDSYALEEALQLRDAQGGEVIALSAGPARVTSTLREALAKGADRAIHLDEPALHTWDTLSTARLLAAAIAQESPDLILTGIQSDDLGAGQTGVILAELLGLPHATIIMQVEPHPTHIRVKRELEDGWFQHVTLPLPALLTIQSGIRPLRYATLMGIKKARTKELKTLTAAELNITPTPVCEVVSLTAPTRTKQTQILSSVAELLDKLRTEAHAL